MAKSKKPGPKATIKKPTGFKWKNNGRKPGGYTLRGASARDRELDGVPAGRRATATAGAAKKPRPAAKPKRKDVTLRDLVRAAHAEGCEIDVSLEPASKHRTTRYETGPGSSVQIVPIPCHWVIFDTQGLRLDVEADPECDGEYRLVLSQNSKVIGKARFADHFRIR